MKKLVLTMLLALALITTVFAGLGRTYQAFTESDFAKTHRFIPQTKYRTQDRAVFISPQKELVILKIKGSYVYYEKLTWINDGAPESEAALNQVLIDFLCQATNIQPETEEYAGLVQCINDKMTEFTLLGNYVVRTNIDQNKEKPFVEIYVRTN
ncbi:MAG: hypothetical protein JXQ27_02035 [Acidobacteria bacterium]|nr:hypothetical protein [Acidobacteriota bacterium]